MSKEETIIDCGEDIQVPENPFGMPAPILQIKNNLYVYGEIDDTLAKSFIVALHENAMENISVSLEHNVPIPPIKIIINSPGGQISSALGIVAAIKDIQNGTIHKINGIPIPVKVDTEIQGEADSAASLIACVGNYRTISKYSLSLIHDVRQLYGCSGKTEDFEDSAHNLGMFKKMTHEIYLAHSKLTEEKLNELAKNEKYSTPDELLEYGLIDEIV